ncbi:MAG: DNA recombination/repair protein RecA [Bryobacteraceae bacterium]|nr:DNA recombination/repair protein RecA [Bryobacteraceae bacterium]MDW8380039.1 hypothetical protein [Bryobacterales bacterium]
MAALPHLPVVLGWRQETPAESVPFQIPTLDAVIAGLPRGRISCLAGPSSSGRTTLLYRALAVQAEEFKALVDTNDCFDPQSAEQAGVTLQRLLWVKCGHRVEHALKSADLLLHAGGFGLIALDLCDVPVADLNHIPASYWYRFQRAVEKSSAVFLVVANQPLAKTAAALILQTDRMEITSPHVAPFHRLHTFRFQVVCRKPQRNQAAILTASLD